MNLPVPKLEWESLPMREQVIARLRQLNADVHHHGGGLHPILEYDFLKDHILLQELEVAIQDYKTRHGKAIEDGVSMDNEPAIRWVTIGDSQIYMAHTNTTETK